MGTMIWTDPLLFTTLSMLGLIGAMASLCAKALRRHKAFVASAVILFDLPRVLLVLPFCHQPRFQTPASLLFIASVVLLCAAIIGLPPCLQVRFFTAPASNTCLRTTGVYAIVRNPMYLGELLFSVGWSLLFGSFIGLGFVVVCWIGLLLHTLVEEQRLTEELGAAYVAYCRRVRGRILPGLPL